MSSNLRVNNIFPSVGTNVAIGTAGGSITLTGGVTGSSIINTGVTTVSAGSTSAPSISPTGDSNTGIFFPSADTIAFAEGGVEAARFDSSGRLGIGTVNPAEQLELFAGSERLMIGANSPSTYSRIAARNVTNTGYRGFQIDGSDLLINSNTSGNITLGVGGGSVGINTANPTDKLTVLGKIHVQQDGSSSNRIILRGQPSSSYRWNIDNYSSSNSFRIFREDDATSASGAVAMSIDGSTRNVTISGGNLIFDSGKGIDFSATANSSGTMTSELLSDYEEGTWTPALANVTIGNGTITGHYTKTGNIVHLSFRFVFGSTSSFAGQVSALSGLPFTNSLASNTGVFTASNASNNWLGFTQQYSTGTATNYIQFIVSGSVNLTMTSTNPFTWTTGDVLRFNMTYRVD